MAHILFVESDPTAIRAFTGVIQRSPHVMDHVQDAENAWLKIGEEKFYHLIVLELKLTGSSGKVLLNNLRSHIFFKRLPVLVYTQVTDRDTVRQTLVQDVQNYLIKPYEEEKLFGEINKSTVAPWWTRYFTPKDKMVSKLGVDLDELNKKYSSIAIQIRRLINDISVPDIETSLTKDSVKKIGELHKRAKELGIPDLSKLLLQLLDNIELHKWKSITEQVSDFSFAVRVIEEHVKPGKHTVETREDLSELEEQEDKPIRSVERIATWSDVKGRLERLEGYPVMESVGASFEMAAREPDIDVRVLVNMIETDPCLTAQVLYFSNVVDQSSKAQIENPKQAIALLGLSRMRKLSSMLIAIPDQNFKYRGFDWRRYWLFQMASAMLSEEIVKILSLPVSSNMAYYAGLLHEIGKPLLCYLYPDGYENAVEYSHDTGIAITETEKHYFGCNNEQAGEYFAEIAKMPEPIKDTIAFHRDPESANSENRELVSVVALADFLCKRHEIGFSGSKIPAGGNSFAQHPAWIILKPVLYEGFTVAKFERQIEDRVKILKRELLGLAERKSRL